MADHRMEKPTRPEVFIIESLTWDNERKEFYEGQVLSKILNMNSIKTNYYYIRTEKELIEVMKFFGRSNNRYLHISCHGNKDIIGTTLDDLSFHEFGNIECPYLNNKRIFISACYAMNDNLADVIFDKSVCLSATGSMEEIYFADAAMVWASFYHLMFNYNPDGMKDKNMIDTLDQIAELFNFRFNYYYRNEKLSDTNITLQNRRQWQYYELFPSKKRVKSKNQSKTQ